MKVTIYVKYEYGVVLFSRAMFPRNEALERLHINHNCVNLL